MAKHIIPWNNGINLDTDTVLLIFSTSWCPPCKALVPVLEQLDTMITDDRIKICKIDCEELPQLAQRFNIKSVPTIILVHKANMKSYSGSRDANSMLQWINGSL